ncbi:cuticle protein 38 [Bactrocera oleae]|uniref:cuticle protein 38 n=1 Tax=Bactrocera oleae TaxID=104688 RepID=UPI00174ADEC0|nr:cuticle protein 16.5 [Bactrocera oleae]
MFKFVTFVLVALVACASAKPGVVAPLAAAPLAYANAPLYAAGGSSQIDVRNNYDGTLSSYTTTPFQYSGPFASRYVSGVPAAYAAAAPVLAKYAAPAVLAARAPLAALPAPFAAAPAPLAALPAPFAAAPAPLTALPAPLAAAPFAAPFHAAYAAAPAPYAW